MTAEKKAYIRPKRPKSEWQYSANHKPRLLATKKRHTGNTEKQRKAKVPIEGLA